MIKLKSLELQGFRKFKDFTKIEFPESGLMLLDGDSGVGKSTILQAISFALDICPFPSTILKSWSGEKLQVKLTVNINGKNVDISRGAFNAIQYEGEEPRTGAKALEEGLRALFGMSPDLLSALTYRPQDQLGLFLSKTDSEKKDFLAKVLGLESIEKVIEESDVKRKDLQSKLQFAQGILAEKEAGLVRLLDQLGEVSPDSNGVDLKERFEACRMVSEQVEAEASQAEKNVKDAYSVFLVNAETQKEGLKIKLGQAKTFLAQFEQANKNSRIVFEGKFSSLKDQIHQTEVEIRNIDAIRQEIKTLETQIRALRANTCYTCHQPFTAEADIDNKEEQLASLKIKLESEPLLRKRKEDLLSLIKDLKWTPDDREGKFSNIVVQIETELKSIGKTITDPRVIQLQEEQSKINQKLYRAKQDFLNAKNDYNQWLALCEAKQNARIKAEASKSGAVLEVEKQRLEVKTLLENYNAELDFLQVLGREGFLGVIFDEVLTEISTQANEIMGKLSNTSHISVHFRSETAKGKKSIVPVFIVDGHETSRSGGLSGGQGTSADLSVDLGLASVVNSRLGNGPGWFCLDESFNGMPRGTKESALEILQQFAQDRLVIVIDHGTEMKESFLKVLTVTEVDGKNVVS